MIALYWDIGQMIAVRQKQEGWAAAVIPKLSKDLKNELPEVSGFSERNLGRMIAFYRAYLPDDSILPQPVAKLANFDLLLSIPWGHHAVLIEKIKDQTIRFWYMQKTIEQGWSRDMMRTMIKNEAYARQLKILKMN